MTDRTVALDDGGEVPARLNDLLVPQDRALRTGLAAHMPVPSAPAKAFAARLVLRELRRLFPDSLVDVLQEGMRRHEDLREAARKSLEAGSTITEVKLYQRKLHTSHHVTVDVLSTLVRFEVAAVLAVDFTAMDAFAEVTRGQLTALSLRDPVIAGELSARVDGLDTGALSHREGTLRLGGRVVFDRPVAILRDDEPQDVAVAT